MPKVVPITMGAIGPSQHARSTLEVVPVSPAADYGARRIQPAPQQQQQQHDDADDDNDNDDDGTGVVATTTATTSSTTTAAGAATAVPAPDITDAAADADANTSPATASAAADTATTASSSSSSKPNPWMRVRASVQAVMAMKKHGSDAKLYGSMAPEAWRRVDSATPRLAHGCILLPDDRVVTWWTFAVFILLMYVVVVLPWRLAFTADAWTWIDVTVDALFFVDMCVTFFVAYEDEKGELVTKHSKIAAHYLRTWLIIDIIATFPFYFFLHDPSSRASSLVRIPKLFKLFRMLRVLKLVRVLRLNVFFERLEDSAHIHPGVYRLLKVWFWFCGLTHVCACVWIFVGKTELLSNETNWLTVYAYDTMSKWGQYNVALYWTISTLTGTGMGDIVPLTHMERVFTTLVMLSGVIFLAYITATIASVFSSLDIREGRFRAQLENLSAFMQNARLPMPLRAKLNHHFRYAWKEPPSSADSKQILRNVPKNLRKEVLTWVHRDLFRLCSFFRHVTDQDFVAEVIMHLAPARFKEGEVIGLYGQPVTDWFIIKRGAVEAQSQHDGSPYMVFRAGSTFGETGLLLTGTWGATFRATEPTEVLSIPSRNLKPLLMEFPATKRQMLDVALERQKRLVNKKIKHDDSISTWDDYDDTVNFLRSRTIFNTMESKTPMSTACAMPAGPGDGVAVAAGGKRMSNRFTLPKMAGPSADDEIMSQCSDYDERSSMGVRTTLPTVFSGDNTTDATLTALLSPPHDSYHRRVMSTPTTGGGGGGSSSGRALPGDELQKVKVHVRTMEKQLDALMAKQDMLLAAVHSMVPY